ncbi:MAG: 4Fe-4S binding protein [Magnetococcales bacterium]|nr:4Fe-4S binding protein [Magnetococcales bacterium]
MTIWKNLNKLRWLVLLLVFALLILLPYFHIYQNYTAAHAYDLLADSEKEIYDLMAWLTDPFVSDPSRDLNAIKGTTWSATFFGLQLSDPLAFLAHLFATKSFYWGLFLSVLIPVALTVVLGRFYCGWICPAGLIYDLTDHLAEWIKRSGIPLRRNRKFDGRLKYVVLGFGLLISAFSSWVALSSLYPPAIVGREIYYIVTTGALGAGAGFFVFTLLFDLLVARHGFCRYLCPGGALYTLIGQYRMVRIQRLVESCNDCGKCNKACPFVLDPMRDGFGMECNNCTACIAECPEQALVFVRSFSDRPDQGPGHAGPAYQKKVSQSTAEAREIRG